MRKLSSVILLIVMLVMMATAFTACDMLEKLIPLKHKIDFPELEDYVLYDDTIEYEGIIYQNSNLGYIGVRLADSSVTEVYMRSHLDLGYNKDGSLNIIPVYAYATDFLCNNSTVTGISLDLHSHLRLYENTVHNVPNVTNFYFVNASAIFYDDGKGTPQIEKNAINVDCDYTVGYDVGMAFQCFPLDVERFVFSRGIGVHTKLKIVFDPPKNGVQPLTSSLQATTTVKLGNHTKEFNNFVYISKEGLNVSNEYYVSVELYHVLLEKGSKLPKEWIPKYDYLNTSVVYDVQLTYEQKKIIVFESTKKHTITASNISVPWEKYTLHNINDNAFVVVEAYLTGVHWD